MNRVCLTGRITAKPELRTTSSGIPYTRFSLAVNRTYSNAQGDRETDFINIVVWRKQAENICRFLDKGSLIAIEGRIQTGSFDGQDGQRRYTTDVVADNFYFLESRAQSQARMAGGNSDMSNSIPAGPSPYDYQEPVTPSTNNVNISNDPFADFGDSVSIDDNFLD